MTKQAGGEFSGAWEALAAAAKPRRKSFAGPFAQHTTTELINDASATNDDELRERLEAEIARRRTRGRK